MRFLEWLDRQCKTVNTLPSTEIKEQEIMEVNIICNRCGEILTSEETYYTIEIYGHDVTPTGDGRVKMDTAVQNLWQNMYRINKCEGKYCKKCKCEIEKFIKGECL